MLNRRNLFAATLAFYSVHAQPQAAMKEVSIVDPVLQMTAWTVPIPATWSLDGTMLPNSSCIDATSPTFWVRSPDGKYGAYLLPRIDWAWGAGVRSGNDCLPLKQTLSARAFILNMLQTRGLTATSDEKVPELPAMQRDTEAFNQQTRGMRHDTVDAARVLTSYTVDGQAVSEVMTAIVRCFDANIMAVGKQSSCSAFVSRWYAPTDKIDSLRPVFIAIKPALSQPWMDRWTQAMRDQSNALSQQQTSVLLQQGRVAQQARTNQQNSFMEAFKSQADHRNGEVAIQQQNKQVQSDNFVDYVLDCSRIYSGAKRVSVGSNCPNRQTF